MDIPIITMVTDADLYKFTMQQAAFLRYPQARVKFGFTCRTRNANLPAVIPVEVLRAQLDYLREVRALPPEIEFLRESKYIPRGMFREPYLQYLSGLELPGIDVEVVGDQFRIEAEANWPDVTLVETMVLSVVNELYNFFLLKALGLPQSAPADLGRARLYDKIRELKASGLRHALAPQCIVEFGTRRRYSRAWQSYVTAVLARELPELFAGTSNVRLAMDLQLRPIGTFAHEMDMVYSRLFGGRDEDIRGSHQRMLRDWWEIYGEPLSIVLTDTYGTDFFFGDFTPEQARDWRGFRHDSGPWRRFGEKGLEFYRSHGIDPTTKSIVWSDGLTPEVVLDIDRTFGRQIKCIYGWGTNLTNDFGPDAHARFGTGPLSIVMKVVSVNGLRAVKFSDNPAKAIGPREAVELFKRAFGYDDARYQYEECTY
jgi:nicotinate phosphoribosyltransferase